MTDKQSPSRKKSTSKSSQTKKASQTAQERAAQDLKQSLRESEQKHNAAMAQVERLQEESQAVARELAETQMRLEEAQNNLELERQAKLEAEQALADAGRMQEEREAEREIVADPGKGGEEKRVSFILRLTINERGEPLRTEIEHAQTRAKKILPAFEPQQIADFVRSCISPEKERKAAPEPPAKAQAGEMPKEGVQVVLSQIRVWHPEAPGITALQISPDEKPFVQVDFELEGAGAPALSDKRQGYDVKLYAKEISSGKPAHIGEQKGKLASAKTEYQTQILMEGLEPGVYRLMATVDIPEISGLAGYLEGPFLRVAHTLLKERPAVTA